ncbi:MAG TPA: hypothetical protein DCE71_02780 [Parachlamydiales bacterium]|nr:hypothetical protein [Parachlamydiales bacterium]
MTGKVNCNHFGGLHLIDFDLKDNGRVVKFFDLPSWNKVRILGAKLTEVILSFFYCISLFLIILVGVPVMVLFEPYEKDIAKFVDEVEKSTFVALTAKLRQYAASCFNVGENK